MSLIERVSTGMAGLDEAIDMLRLGDNVVWQINSMEEYGFIARRFTEQAVKDRRRIVYMRFGAHAPVIDVNAMRGTGADIARYDIDASKGFETFAAEVHAIAKGEGIGVFYVFDCLTDLQRFWRSDLMIGNFFCITCPYLFELETIAYFPLIYNCQTYDTIARIRDTTQVLLNLYSVDQDHYIHPLKVWKRYSPTMFFPHLIRDELCVSITSSRDAAGLFSQFIKTGEKRDCWDIIFDQASEKLGAPQEEQEREKELLIGLLIGNETRMLSLCREYFTLADLLGIKQREIGSGLIGGKSVGMLLARKILETKEPELYQSRIEVHDSYYFGSDVFYTYIVQNDCWRLRTIQKTEDGYYRYAPQLKEKLLKGHFPSIINEQIMSMLEYFGQSPMIVRSSSLLEDGFGNAFAGKYESVFCANQGTLEQRYNAFLQAVRTVYASTMNEDALAYRADRGLLHSDEQMALLVQRVSGDCYGKFFFPHIAGVGNSTNLYIWDKDTDITKGMIRLVFGMGTRAVDRITGDYARTVSLDQPSRPPIVAYGDEYKFSQHNVDLINLEENAFETVRLDALSGVDIKIDRSLFMEPDRETLRRFAEQGVSDRQAPYLLNFGKLLKTSAFPGTMRTILETLSTVYDYPVDVEFTCNFSSDSVFCINLLQCRPLQTKGLGNSVEFPANIDTDRCLFSTQGNFMGGNVRLAADYVVFVRAETYLALREQDKYAVARAIGRLNGALKGKNAILIGPGRWGTTTPSLGVPVHFMELSNMSAICEVAYKKTGLMPELSYGSHFFQDLVESSIFYAALFQGDEGVTFNEEMLLSRTNLFELFCPEGAPALRDVIHVACFQEEKMELFSDISRQSAICVMSRR